METFPETTNTRMTEVQVLVDIFWLKECIHIDRDELNIGNDEKIIEAEEQKNSNTNLKYHNYVTFSITPPPLMYKN